MSAWVIGGYDRCAATEFGNVSTCVEHLNVGESRSRRRGALRTLRPLGGPTPRLLTQNARPSMKVTPTSVYRYYDRHGVLIYVGITHRDIRRNLEHNKRARWWPYVVRQEVDHFETRDQALAHEKALIFQYRPPFNTQHNPDAESLRDVYVAFAARDDASDDPMAAFRAIGAHARLTVASQSSDLRFIILRSQPSDCVVARHLLTGGGTTIRQPVVTHRGSGVGKVRRIDLHAGAVAVLDVSVTIGKAEGVGLVQSAICGVKIHSQSPLVFRIGYVELLTPKARRPRFTPGTEVRA